VIGPQEYLARAAEARSAADSATLENVRAKCLRSEEAWLAMASRIERIAEFQIQNDSAKLAEQYLPEPEEKPLVGNQLPTQN